MFTRKTSAKKTSIDITLPPPTVLYGITIREQPVDVYLETVRRLGGILYEIFDAVFPDQKPGQVFVSFMTITPEEFKGVIIRVMAIAPEKALEILASVMGTTGEHLKNLSPLKLAKVCEAFWKVNSLSDFFQMARRAMEPALRAMKAPNGGSSA